jgi:glucoamylase
MLSTAFFIRSVFSGLYFINLTHREEAPLIGRYINDKYDGKNFIHGNPWPLVTTYLAQFYYEVAANFWENKKIEVNSLTINFLKQLNPELTFTEFKIITPQNNKVTFNTIISSLIKAGDEMLIRVKRSSICEANLGCLHLAEQIDRASGKQVSATDLTWGYISILSALQSREKVTDTISKK